MSIIIDPPVNPYSERSEIEAWIDELKVMRAKFADDPDAIQTIDRNIRMAVAWLDNRPQDS